MRHVLAFEVVNSYLTGTCEALRNYLTLAIGSNKVSRSILQYIIYGGPDVIWSIVNSLGGAQFLGKTKNSPAEKSCNVRSCRCCQPVLCGRPTVRAETRFWRHTPAVPQVDGTKEVLINFSEMPQEVNDKKNSFRSRWAQKSNQFPIKFELSKFLKMTNKIMDFLQNARCSVNQSRSIHVLSLASHIRFQLAGPDTFPRTRCVHFFSFK